MTSIPSVTKRKVQTTPIPQVGTRVIFASAFALSSIEDKNWITELKRKQKLLSPSTINDKTEQKITRVRIIQ